jgi:phage terminase large subunit-like protein
MAGRRETPGARAVRLINQLTHTKGPDAGRPFNLRPWQARIVRQLFTVGRDGRRRYRSALLMLPRKNGKTEIAAALAVYFLLLDGEIGAEVYSAAAEKEQAALVFGVAAQMIRNAPELAAECEILESQKRIVHRASGSFYRALSAEAYSKHGLNPSCVIFDEIHALPDRTLYDVLVTSQGARARPLFFGISTAGYDKHSILWELYSHAKRVLEEPALDPSFLPVVYEAPAEADWTSEKVWRACNPALDDFRSLDDMRVLAARAKEIPAQENTFKRLYLNIWTEQETRWLSLASWDACRVELDVAALAGRRCYVGLDLSRTNDLTAAVAVFPDDDGPGFAVLPHFFVPQERILVRSTRDRVPYDAWVHAGLITASEGPEVKYEDVRAKLLAWREVFDMRILAVDPWNAVGLTETLEKVDKLTVVKVRQGKASLSAPSKALEKAVLERSLRHDGHPVLRWNLGNAAVDTDHAGNIQPSKAKSTERIDGVVALVMAIDAMTRDAGGTPEPAYQMVILGGPA